MVQRYETLSRRTIRLSPNSYNKTGCRFLIVDAYNCMVPLDFYQKNEFLFLFSTEQQEAENLGYDMTKSLHTRLMYYDLKKLTSN